MNNLDNRTNKFLKAMGWFFIIAGILMFITTIITLIDWNSKKNNYTLQYAYSEAGNLYYELDNKIIPLDIVYNTSNEKITLEIPDNNSILVYTNNNNLNEGIYFDMNNSIDQSILKPTFYLLIPLFLIGIGLFIILNQKEKKENKYTTSPVFLFCLFLFIMGLYTIILESTSIISHFNLKSQNNITTATIYSQLYDNGASSNTYKPIAHYHIDDKKYIYVNDTYIDGSLEDTLGNTFELYYDKCNPTQVSKAENHADFLIIFAGVFLILFSFPFIFMKKHMDKVSQKMYEQNDNKWKI